MSSRTIILAVLAGLYLAGAILAASNVIKRAEGSTQAIEKIFGLYSLQNEGAQSLAQYDKDHPFLGMLINSPVKKALDLPSTEESNNALHSELPHFLKLVREESSAAAWWSWFLLSLSFFYIVAVVTLERSITARGVLFALTTVSVICFVIGILAPAMIIWTEPTIPMQTGKLTFVLQHQVRGIAAIIWDLLKAGHWIIGGFLLLFSICTPLTKASLTFFVTASPSRKINHAIGEFLHHIGKWSMADVFVAATLLALYALKFQEATKSVPCIGLYYFIGYCMLSMTTTQLLAHSEATGAKRSGRRLGLGVVGMLFAGLFCFMSASGLYTYDQYTLNTKQELKAPSSPTQLDNSHLVLPGHK